MLCVVAPVDHNHVVPILDVRVTLPPVHKVIGPEAVIVGAAGRGFTVTTTGSDKGLSQPSVFVTFTV